MVGEDLLVKLGAGRSPAPKYVTQPSGSEHFLAPWLLGKLGPSRA